MSDDSPDPAQPSYSVVPPYSTWAPLFEEEARKHLPDLKGNAEALAELQKDWEIDWNAILTAVTEDDGQIGLEIPPALRPYLFAIVDYLTAQKHVTVFTSINPCFGACDDRIADFHRVGIRKLVHFGNAPIPNLRCESVVFVELFSRKDVTRWMEDVIEALRARGAHRVGLLSSVQYVRQLRLAHRLLREAGFSAAIGRGDLRTAYEGQVLGCNVSAALAVPDAEAFLYVGHGTFHLEFLSCFVSADVLCLDPISERVFWYSSGKERLVKRRRKLVEESRNARRFGVLVSSKSGQVRASLGIEVVEKLRRAGKEAYLFVVDNLYPMYVSNLGVDALVFTGCPRVALNNQTLFNKPLLTPPEIDLLVSGRSDDYRFDQIDADSNRPAG